MNRTAKLLNFVMAETIVHTAAAGSAPIGDPTVVNRWSQQFKNGGAERFRLENYDPAVRNLRRVFARHLYVRASTGPRHTDPGSKRCGNYGMGQDEMGVKNLIGSNRIDARTEFVNVTKMVIGHSTSKTNNHSVIGQRREVAWMG